MDYIGPIAGSPIIPPQLPYFYFIFALLTFVVFLIHNRKREFPQSAGRAFMQLIILHLAADTLITLVAVFLLLPQPKISSATHANVPHKGPIEINFTRPVMRSVMVKSIEPEVPGLWVFKNPVYATHLYRSLEFYPTFALSPDTTYSVTLFLVSNFLQLSAPSTYTLKFQSQPASLADMKTLDDNSPSVLGITDDKNTETSGKRVRVIGSFPQDKMTDVATDQTIKIRFSEMVDASTAQQNFSIVPKTEGIFAWHGQTMEFIPSDLSFSTRYTYFVASGVKASLSRESTNGYAATFTTRSPVTKLDVPSYLQKYALSCEVAGLRMVLAYRGVEVSEDELLAGVGYDPTANSGSLWGNPYVGFVGNVRGKQMVNGYGVYWEPIARAANRYRYAVSFEKWNLTKLTSTIEKGFPVITWVYVKNGKPTNWHTPTGDRIYAVPGEHVVVAVGFMGPPSRPSHIIVNDPLVGQAYWERDLFERKWDAFGRSGVLVY